MAPHGANGGKPGLATRCGWATATAASPDGARRALRRAAASTPQQEQEVAEPRKEPEGGWSEELQREFEAYQSETPVGGYYPVLEGEKFKAGRYTVVQFLGQGHYSTVWRVLDSSNGQFCAMKVVKSAAAYTEAARDEVALLQAVAAGDPADAKHCVRLLDQFEHAGPHGSHVCEVFGVMGDDLLALIRVYKHKGIPLPIVRHLTRQSLVALDYLHTHCQIIHTDIKPENVMLTDTVLPGERSSAGTKPPRELTHEDRRDLEERLLRTGCKLVDFGNACWSHTHFSETIQTRQYRAPEVILGAGYDGGADIWSLGCLVFELATGQYLFNPRTVGTRGRDRDHLTQMVQRLGHMPRRVATKGRHSHDFFSADGRLWHMPGRLVPHWPLDKVLQEQYGIAEDEAMGLASFLHEMLQLDPSRRSTAAQLLEHPWLEGALPRRPRSTSPTVGFWGIGDGDGDGSSRGSARGGSNGTSLGNRCTNGAANVFGAGAGGSSAGAVADAEAQALDLAVEQAVAVAVAVDQGAAVEDAMAQVAQALEEGLEEGQEQELGSPLRSSSPDRVPGSHPQSPPEAADQGFF